MEVVVMKVVVEEVGPRHLRLAFARGRWRWWRYGGGGGATSRLHEGGDGAGAVGM